MSDTVLPDSLVTLHYSIMLENGQPLISTFDGKPATLQLGAGELLPNLECLLAGLHVGSTNTFALEPERAFGAHRADLVERVRREHIPDPIVETMSIMEFTAPDGSRYSGLVTEADETSALIDFNHPLAGKAIRFDVEIIGVL